MSANEGKLPPQLQEMEMDIIILWKSMGKNDDVREHTYPFVKILAVIIFFQYIEIMHDFDYDIRFDVTSTLRKQILKSKMSCNHIIDPFPYFARDLILYLDFRNFTIEKTL